MICISVRTDENGKTFDFRRVQLVCMHSFDALLLYTEQTESLEEPEIIHLHLHLHPPSRHIHDAKLCAAIEGVQVGLRKKVCSIFSSNMTQERFVPLRTREKHLVFQMFQIARLFE